MILESAAWLGLLILPVLIVLVHLLGHGVGVRPVSSVRLWREFSSSITDAQRLSRPRPLTRVLLMLSILTCLSLAAAGPWFVRHEPLPALAVVLDCSESMGTVSDAEAPPRIDTGREVALFTLTERSDVRLRILILAGHPMRAVTATPGDEAPFNALLRDLSLSAGEPALASSVEVAAGLVRAAGGGRVVVVSDFTEPQFSPPPDATGEGVEFEMIEVGDAAWNVALTSLVVSRHAGPGGTLEAAATVSSTVGAPDEVTLTGILDGAPFAETTMRISPGETATWKFTAASQSGALLGTRVHPGGALASDDAVQHALPRALDLHVPRQRSLPPEIATAIEVLQSRMLDLGKELQVEVFNERLPERLPAHWLFLASASAGAERRQEPALALEVVHAAGEFLDPYQPVLIDPARLSSEQPPANSVPIAFAGGRPAIALFEEPHSRGVWCGVPLEATDLVARGVLPLVLIDMLDWVAGVRPASSRTSHAEPSGLIPAQARPAASVLRRDRPRPRSLRAALLWLATGLLVLEARRRLVDAGRSPLAPGKSRAPWARKPAAHGQGVRARGGQ